MPENHRVREACMVCEGSGRNQGQACPYCEGSGQVFSRLEGPGDVLVATGGCKVPARRRSLEGVRVMRNFT